MTIKKTVKISYLQREDDKGTIYNKSFSITEKMYDDFLSFLFVEQEKARKENDYYKALYLTTRLTRLSNVVFLNLTQARTFVEWLENSKNIIFNRKRANYNANACLIID